MKIYKKFIPVLIVFAFCSAKTMAQTPSSKTNSAAQPLRENSALQAKQKAAQAQANDPRLQPTPIPDANSAQSTAERKAGKLKASRNKKPQDVRLLEAAPSPAAEKNTSASPN